MIKQTSINNVYDLEPKNSNQEIFTDLFKSDDIRIEKIISYGQVTPADQPYIQAHDEWVVVLSGQAQVKLEDSYYTLKQGQHLFIAKNTRHWVTFTTNPTIWLAIHFGRL
ncbi:cupin domain-containing protein [Francisella hispaniensis]|uniref:cupin domain-containing protein n=1 Tax=Francisella hispaniensis TaxID=622488 RepID=UPI0019059F88|nr:cupin domain-containing protein [Francisella hispaniensis]MBK2356948.1 cupin domain-containing protein [Francisella hispaniensis]